MVLGAEFSKEIQILNDSSDNRWGHIRSTMMLSEEGKLEGYVTILEDITDRKRAEGAIRANARMEEELKTAAAVQNSLFPDEIPQSETYQLASFFESASETGGDWYGFITRAKDSLFILIGDVTGHGTPAALVTATASATCRMLEDRYAQGYEKPSPITTNINHPLCG